MRLNISMGAAGEDPLKRLGRRIQAATRQAVRNVTYDAQREIELNLTGRVLRVRTGALRTGWATAPKFEETEQGLSMRLRPNVPYARIHEEGGTIRPTNAKFLTIPVGRAAMLRDRTNRTDVTARDFIENPGLLGYDRAFFSKKGAICGVRGSGAGQTVEAVFLLRTSVAIPPRRYVSLALENVRAHVPQLVRSAIVSAARGREA